MRQLQKKVRAVVDEHVRLMVKVARLYHQQGIRQQNIADLLSLSQSRVSRLLKEAQERGIIRLVVDVPEGIHAELEDQVESHLGLQQAVVVDESNPRDLALGAAAAAYFQTTLTSDAVVGVSTWSSSLIAMVNALHMRGSSTTHGVKTVVQMFGGIGSPDVQFEATRLTSELARRIGGEPVFMPAPAVVGNPKLVQALTQEPDIANVMKQWSSISMSLVGIGRLEPSPLLAKSGNALTDQEMSELQTRGAVGDVCLRYFDAQGQPMASSFDERVVGMSADAIRSVSRRIGVAGGLAKVPAIRGAALGGWVNVLVTDVETATALVNY